MNVWEFFTSPNAREAIRLIDGLVVIVAAILSGAAAKNARQAKRMIGGTLEKSPGLISRIVKDRRKVSASSSELRFTRLIDQDPAHALTLAQKIDMLKTNQETMHVRQGLRDKQILDRLDHLDRRTGDRDR